MFVDLLLDIFGFPLCDTGPPDFGGVLYGLEDFTYILDVLLGSNLDFD